MANLTHTQPPITEQYEITFARRRANLYGLLRQFIADI